MKKIFRDTFRVMRPKEKKRFFWLTLAGTIINIADIAAIALLLIVIRFYIEPGTLPLHLFPGPLADPASPALAIAFLLLFAIKNAAAYFIQQAQHELNYDVALRLSHDLLLRYYTRPDPERIATDSSVSGRRIAQQPIEFGHHILGSVQQIITQAVLVCFAILAILLYHPATFLLLLLILLPPVLLAGWWLKKRTGTIRSSGRKSSEASSMYLREALAAYTDVQLYGNPEYFMLRYLKQQAKQNEQLTALQNIQALPGRLIEVFAILGLVILILLRNTLGGGGLDLMITGAFLGAAYRIIPGMVKILNSTAQMRAYAFTIPELLPANLAGVAPEKMNEPLRKVRFENIRFPHNPQLAAFSAELQSGEMTGISGPSGAGKTTLLRYLLGFSTPENGNVILNEATSGLRPDVAYVPQQAVLLHDSIRENITLGRTISDTQRLETILDVTGIRTWTDTLADGLETIVNERGGNISGGQAQRIIIARALLEERDCYLLDEPFNELDAASVQRIFGHFRAESRKGKMVILVTHDPVCLHQCDTIIPLHAG